MTSTLPETNPVDIQHIRVDDMKINTIYKRQKH